jgi:hypothetical protein
MKEIKSIDLINIKEKVIYTDRDYWPYGNAFNVTHYQMPAVFFNKSDRAVVFDKEDILYMIACLAPLATAIVPPEDIERVRDRLRGKDLHWLYSLIV